jgi:hypothetical protein
MRQPIPELGPAASDFVTHLQPISGANGCDQLLHQPLAGGPWLFLFPTAFAIVMSFVGGPTGIESCNLTEVWWVRGHQLFPRRRVAVAGPPGRWGSEVRRLPSDRYVLAGLLR